MSRGLHTISIKDAVKINLAQELSSTNVMHANKLLNYRNKNGFIGKLPRFNITDILLPSEA